MVTVLQLNRMELKDMIINEIAENPVLEEATEPGEELTQGEIQELLERVREGQPADQDFLERGDAGGILQVLDTPEPEAVSEPFAAGSLLETVPIPAEEAPKTETDPFEEIDFGSFFDDYLDPGFKSPASESVEKPSFETFLSSPVTLSDHQQSQLSVLVLPERTRQAANSIVGNLEESGYLTTPIEEIAELTNIGTLFAFTLVCLGVWILRRVDPEQHRPFRTPWVPVVPILGVGFCVFLMARLPMVTWIRFFVWLAIGLVIYFTYGRFHSRVDRDATVVMKSVTGPTV